MIEDCGCIKCTNARTASLPADAAFSERFQGPGMKFWRYACEICGNKRCPHHSDHTLACTNSNATGQRGSVFQP